MMKCNQCGKELEPQTYWYGEVLQVLWYCEEDRCGWVRDVYFTKSDYPSPFADANLKGCPTDGEMQLAQDTADQERIAWCREYRVDYNGGSGSIDKVIHQWAEGRGYGDFPKEDAQTQAIKSVG